MVPDTGLRNDRNVTAECFEPFLQQQDIFLRRQICISITVHRNAPEYLKGRKPPTEPEDLKMHDCVILDGKNNETDWDLLSGRRKVRVHVSGPVSSRDFNSVSTFVYRGHGIGLLPSTYCDEQLAKGGLRRLMPKWTSPQIPVFAVYPSRRFLPSRLNVFLQALTGWKSPLWIRE